MARVLAGVTSDTFKHLQIGPGAIIKNFEYSTLKTYKLFQEGLLKAIKDGKSFGGTEGGISIEITPTYEQYEIDGANMPFKGSQYITEWVCQMSTTLKEFTPIAMQAAFPTSQFTNVDHSVTPEGATEPVVTKDILAQRIQTDIDNGHYDTNHTWVASTKFGYIMVAFFNALGQTTGAIEAPSEGAGGIPFQSNGYNENFDDIDYAPCEIWYIYKDGREFGVTEVKA